MARTPKPPAPPLPTENEIQKAVFSHLKTRGSPGIVAFHPKNSGSHQIGRRRGINAGLGVLSGIPDVIMIKGDFDDPGVWSRPVTRVFALELKRTPKDKLSEEQVKVLARLETTGTVVGVAYGLDEALAWLEQRGLLKGKVGR